MPEEMNGKEREQDDSINYSPPLAFSDNEIQMLLNQIRRGF